MKIGHVWVFNTRVIEKVSFPIFFLAVLWTDQREIAGKYHFWVSGNTPLCAVALIFLPPRTNQLLIFISPLHTYREQ